jgi:hypothetical protein
MLIINHRINHYIHSINSINDGVEIDVRCFHNQIYMNHDPLKDDNIKNYSLLESYLQHLSEKHLVIVNLKEEGIENQCNEILKRYHKGQWFFLDMSQPYLIRFAYQLGDAFKSIGKNQLAVRYSALEPKEYAFSFKDKVSWVWVDFFFKDPYPINLDIVKQFRQHNFKICLVSPELQGFSEDIVAEYAHFCKDLKIDAVTTKYPHIWNYHETTSK